MSHAHTTQEEKVRLTIHKDKLGRTVITRRSHETWPARCSRTHSPVVAFCMGGHRPDVGSTTYYGCGTFSGFDGKFG